MVSRPAAARSAFQLIDLLAELRQRRFHLAQAGVELFSLFLGLGQALQGGGVLLGGGLQFRVERRPLLVQLPAPLLGGGDRHAIFGQRLGRLLVLLVLPLPLLLTGGDLFVQCERRFVGPPR